MHTGHDNERHHSGKGGHTDEAQGVVQPQDEGAQVGAQERTDGAEDAVGQGDHDDDGQQRLQHGTQDVRGVLGKELLDGGHDGAAQDDGEDGAGVAHAVHGDAQEVEGGAVADAAGKGRVDQQAADDHAQGGVGTKLLGGECADHDGQEVEASVTGKGEQLVCAAVGGHAGHVHQDQDDFDHAAANQSGDKRGQRAGDAVEDFVDDSLGTLLLGGLFIVQLLVHGFLHGEAVLLANQAVGIVDSLADDDLVLAVLPLGAENTGQFFDFVFFNGGLVLHVKTQAGHAVGKKLDIGFAADKTNDLVRKLLIFLCHYWFLFLDFQCVWYICTKGARFPLLHARLSLLAGAEPFDMKHEIGHFLAS